MSNASAIYAKLGYAVADWRNAVGYENVEIDPKRLREAETATFATDQRIAAIVRPANREQVRDCLQIATRHEVAVHPVSRGRNWGFGSRVPARSDAALLDLGRMDRIFEFDERLAYLVVEPGVTFQQVHDFLQSAESNLFLPPTGGPPDGSVIGNALERGTGCGPAGIRADQVCAFEVVLPNGEILRTGFDRFENASTRHLSRWGLGPDLGGLFLQSGFGVVTRMTVWLARHSECHLAFEGQVDRAGELAPAIDKLRELMQNGVLAPNTVYLWNGYKRLSVERSYPWADTGGETPLRSREGLRWHICGIQPLPSRAHAAPSSDLIESALGGVLDEFTILSQEPEDQQMIRETLQPGTVNLRSVYWRKRGELPENIDPERDRCGVIWLTANLPFDGPAVTEALEPVEEISLSYGFEPNLGFETISPRSLNLFAALIYDRAAPGPDQSAHRKGKADPSPEDRRARECHDAIARALAERGHLPFRRGIQSAGQVPESDPVFQRIFRECKRVCDPMEILVSYYEGSCPGSEISGAGQMQPAAEP